MNLRGLKLAFAYLAKKPKLKMYPRIVGIESTNNCNLDCIMCPRQEMTRKVFDIELGLFKKIIEDIKGKSEFIWLQDYGEPFLNKNIFKMIAIAKSAGLKVGISTNGTVLTDAIIDGILSSGLDYLIFAIDGATKETYEKIRVGANYEKVHENVLRFLRKRQQSASQIFTVVQCIYMKETKNQIQQFKEMWNLPGVNAVRIRQLTYSGTGEFKNTPSRKPCYWLWSNPHIKNDGTVVPCCQDVNATLPLGNIQENSLDEIWNSPAMQDLRKKHLSGNAHEIDLCRNCNMYQPSLPLVLASAPFDSMSVNRWVPRLESLLSKIRY